MFGRPEVALSCSADTETAHVYVALCHVMSGAGGGYRLVTWGVANMNGEQQQQYHYWSCQCNWALTGGFKNLISS